VAGATDTYFIFLGWSNNVHAFALIVIIEEHSDYNAKEP
jgi:hypothetical protein